MFMFSKIPEDEPSQKFFKKVGDNNIVQINSLGKLFKSLGSDYNYRQILTPRWKNFKLNYHQKTRVNNAIWRNWYIQFKLNKKPRFCQFNFPIYSKVNHVWSQIMDLEVSHYRRNKSLFYNTFVSGRSYIPIFELNRKATEVVDQINENNTAIFEDSMEREPSVKKTTEQNSTIDGFEAFCNDLFISYENSFYKYTTNSEHRSSEWLQFLQPDLNQLYPRINEDFWNESPLNSFLNETTSDIPIQKNLVVTDQRPDLYQNNFESPSDIPLVLPVSQQPVTPKKRIGRPRKDDKPKKVFNLQTLTTHFVDIHPRPLHFSRSSEHSIHEKDRIGRFENIQIDESNKLQILSPKNQLTKSLSPSATHRQQSFRVKQNQDLDELYSVSKNESEALGLEDVSRKPSISTILSKAINKIRDLRSELVSCDAKLEFLNTETKQNEEELTYLQSKIPDISAESKHLNQNYISRMSLLKQRISDDPKFWVFSVLMEPIWSSFIDKVYEHNEFLDFETRLKDLLFDSFSISNMRKNILCQLRKISVNTCIVNSPEKIYKQAEYATKFLQNPSLINDPLPEP